MNRRLLLLWSILIVGVSPISQQEVLAHEIELNAKAEVKDLVWEKLNKKKQQLPTGKRPFIFFHQRKAGGSSVRAMLEKAANQNKLNFWIPCHGGVSCEDTEIPLTLPQKSIYAGHIEWSSFTKHMARLTNSRATLNPTQQQFECLTIFREPVSRVQSCWNFRFLKVGRARGARPFAQYTVDELKNILPRAESIQAEGCNNEPMRLFSDLSSADTKINTLTTGPISGDVGTTDHAYDEEGWDLDTNFILNNTVRHMQHCVIGISERCEDTRRVIQFFFPWFTSFSCEVYSNRGKFSADDNLLTPGVISEVKRQNALEIILYNIANLTLDVQLQAIQEIEEAARVKQGLATVETVNMLHFLHIPKTGGTSVENLGHDALGTSWGRFDRSLIRNGTHCSVWHVPQKVLSGVSFCTLRNPATKFVGQFHHENEPTDYCNNATFDKWTKTALMKFEENPYYYDCHYLPQVQYAHFCDYRLRFEHLNEDIRNLLTHYHFENGSAINGSFVIEQLKHEPGGPIQQAKRVKTNDTEIAICASQLAKKIEQNTRFMRLYADDFRLWRTASFNKSV